eukprot:CAMPEP_0169309156 /NCGR_PEP_ID=MMETSP1017-20121227/2260_1 /TAXON_ID=342587 /ORGANISM="Karlodinium micrum, Strain CCMP2283" /LENGTH=64 /DNA_ID=CAMNT_0009402661 /DNA_START=360 /DNA_END=554 /DNA_ORIENTATION=-
MNAHKRVIMQDPQVAAFGIQTWTNQRMQEAHVEKSRIMSATLIQLEIVAPQTWTPLALLVRGVP